MRRPIAVDFFCGAGGASEGLRRAGFYVIGIDVQEMPNYCGDEFVRADALDVLADPTRFLGARPIAAAHASPPCQAYSPLNAYNGKDYPDLIAPVRELLDASGLPYSIENVVQAPLRNPVVLCGAMFGLRVYRHRGFETNFPLESPQHQKHTARCIRNGYLPTKERPFMSIHGGKHSKAWQRKAAEVMGVPWMQTIAEVCEAIPPAYAEYVGARLLDAVRRKEATVG